MKNNLWVGSILVLAVCACGEDQLVDEELGLTESEASAVIDAVIPGEEDSSDSIGVPVDTEQADDIFRPTDNGIQRKLCELPQPMSPTATPMVYDDLKDCMDEVEDRIRRGEIEVTDRESGLTECLADRFIRCHCDVENPMPTIEQCLMDATKMAEVGNLNQVK